MRPLNVHYDGAGWNADYVAGLTQDEFVAQFAATFYGHLPLQDRIKAAATAYQFITSEHQRIKSSGKPS